MIVSATAAATMQRDMIHWAMGMVVPAGLLGSRSARVVLVTIMVGFGVARAVVPVVLVSSVSMRVLANTG